VYKLLQPIVYKGQVSGIRGQTSGITGSPIKALIYPVTSGLPKPHKQEALPLIAMGEYSSEGHIGRLMGRG